MSVKILKCLLGAVQNHLCHKWASLQRVQTRNPEMSVQVLQSSSMFIECVLKYIKRWRNNLEKGCTCQSLPSEYSVCDLPLNLHSKSEQPKWSFSAFRSIQHSWMSVLWQVSLVEHIKWQSNWEKFNLERFFIFGQHGDAAVCTVASKPQCSKFDPCSGLLDVEIFLVIYPSGLY